MSADNLSLPTEQPSQRGGELHILLLLIAVSLLIGTYFLGRYGGRWAETDTANLTLAIRNVVNQEKLVPQERFVYATGFAYQAIGAFVIKLTGVDAATLQQLIYPLTLGIIVAPVWVLCREVAGSRWLTLLGTIALCTQPELLFVILRGSHEKFGRLLVVLMLFLLLRSFRERGNTRRFTAYVLAFYLCIFAFISANFLISFAFISALTLAFMGGMTLNLIWFRSSADKVLMSRLQFLSLICFVVAFIVMFYLYTPVQYTLFVMQSLTERVSALLFGDREATNSYSRVLQAWVDPWAYIAISLSNWLVLGASFLTWLSSGLRWLRTRRRPDSDALWLLWLLYGAFGLQALGSILSDASGSFGNLLHRFIPNLAILGILLILAHLVERPRRARIPQWGRAALAVGLSALTILSIAKATNEPLLVNWWIFYSEPELQALTWTEQHSVATTTWTGYSERLVEAYKLTRGVPGADNRLDAYEVNPATANFLVSDGIRAQAVRLSRELPIRASMLQIYDSGTTQIWRRRPQTPYQR